ncbi:hypothetical protein BDV10DRAFT_19151 [Aspergillus recurvatus]
MLRSLSQGTHTLLHQKRLHITHRSYQVASSPSLSLLFLSSFSPLSLLFLSSFSPSSPG